MSGDADARNRRLFMICGLFQKIPVIVDGDGVATVGGKRSSFLEDEFGLEELESNAMDILRNRKEEVERCEHAFKLNMNRTKGFVSLRWLTNMVVCHLLDYDNGKAFGERYHTPEVSSLFEFVLAFLSDDLINAQIYLNNARSMYQLDDNFYHYLDLLLRCRIDDDDVKRLLVLLAI